MQKVNEAQSVVYRISIHHLWKSLSQNLIALHFRSLLEKFLLDTNIFGIDVGRNLHNANNETLLLLYQPNLMFSKPYYNVTDTGARQYLQVYLDYLLRVSKFSMLPSQAVVHVSVSSTPIKVKSLNNSNKYVLHILSNLIGQI